ncbi:reverse transcriptase domain-containing protein [Tanacetum coccineum]
MNETLYHAWERYNDLLYRYPQHDLNYQHEVHIFYTGLDIPTRRMLDSRGFIPLMTPTQALKSIQVMAEHSHNWYDETTIRERINDSEDNVDAIQANDELMWVADRVDAPTPGSAITIPETANEFAIKDTKSKAVRLMMFTLSLIGEVKTWLDELNEGTIETWDELRTAFISRFFPPSLFDRHLGEIRAFSQNENESLTDAWLRMKEMLRNCHGHNLSKGNIIKIFYHGLSEITQEVLNAAAGGIFLYKTPN